MKTIKSNTLPRSESLDKLVDFFDDNDMGDYMDNMPEVRFDVDLKRNVNLFSIDDDIATGITRIARSKNIPTQTLINNWLKEKLQQQAG